MTKIGELIDSKLANIEESINNTEKSLVKKTEVETAHKIRKTFARFEDLITDNAVPTVSTRVKMLIKNMIENRASGWEKSKKQNESGPMKVEDLRK